MKLHCLGVFVGCNFGNDEWKPVGVPFAAALSNYQYESAVTHIIDPLPGVLCVGKGLLLLEAHNYTGVGAVN